MALEARLAWRGGVLFDAEAGRTRLVIDSDGAAGPSPMQALALAISGCMAVDVATILEKGRHPLAALTLSLTAATASTPPKRLTAVTLSFQVNGDVPASAVERAIRLSREKYCSVWHSLREDIELTTRFDIQP